MSGDSFSTSLLIFVSVCAALSGGACFRLDRSMHTLLLQLLEVARGLDRHDAFRLIHDLFEVAALVVEGKFAHALAGLEDQLARLPKVRMMTAHARHQYEAGLQFFIGRNQLLRLDSESLACAERIDALGAKHDRLMAHFLRRTYYLYRGDLAAAKQEEERFDAMAASFGSRWTADVMGVLEFVPYHLAGDVVALKRTLHRIERLVVIAPELSTYRDVIRAMYEGHRGRPDRALQIYASVDAQLAPFKLPIWAVARSHQAECLNLLGRPAEALAVCQAALAELRDEDRIYVFAYQQLERESALALARLGRTQEARALIDALLASCSAYGNPLITGLIHHDLARLACLTRDQAAFELHLEAARGLFAQSNNPALVARAKRLVELGRSAGLLESLPSFEVSVDLGTDPARGLRPKAHDRRAERVLDEVVRELGAASACLFVVRNGRVLLGARRGDSEHVSTLRREVGSNLEALTEASSEDEISNVVSRVQSEASLTRHIVPLVTVSGAGRRLIGLVVLGECERSEALHALDLEHLASELKEADDDTAVI